MPIFCCRRNGVNERAIHLSTRKFNNRQDLYAFVDQMYIDLRNQLKFPNNENWWPLLRIQLVYRLIMVDEVSYMQFKQKFNVPELKANSSFVDRVRLFIEKRALRKKTDALAQVEKSSWCLVGFKEHYYPANEGVRNLYLSPFENLLKQKRKICSKFILGTIAKEDDPQGIRQCYNLWLPYYRKVFAMQANSNRWTLMFENNTTVIRKYLEAHGITDDLFDTSVLSHVQYEHLPVYWSMRATFQSKGITNIWLYCYYDLTVMSLIRAAHDLNIKVHEYQHSAQGENHFAYSKLVGIEGAENFFPDVFVVWSEGDASRIKTIVSTATYKPTTLVTGNLAIAEDISKYNYKTLDAVNGIIITLQGYWLPEFVVQTIEQSVGITWYIRFHPRYPFDREKGEELFKKFPSKVEIDKANSLSLAELFTKCILHVTDSSGGALEAVNYATPTVIIGNNGLVTYSEQLSGNTMKSALNRQEFQSIIDDRQNIIGIVNMGSTSFSMQSIQELLSR